MGFLDTLGSTQTSSGGFLNNLGKTSTPKPTNSDSIWSQLAGFGSKPAPQTTAPLANPITEYVGGVKEAASQGINATSQALTDINTPSNQNPVIRGIEKGLALESGVASTISAPIAPLMKPVSAVVNAIGDNVSNLSAVQRFAQSSAGQTTARVAEDLSNAGNIAGTITGVDQVVKAIPKIPNKLAEIKTLLTNTPEDIATKQASIDAAAKYKIDTQINNIAQDWQKPTEESTASFNKAKQALSKSPDTPKFLAQQGLSPFDHIENGRYMTEDTAQSLRDTAGQMSRDTLRPSLQAADYSTPKTLVSDISVPDSLIQSQGRGVTPDDVEVIQSKIQSKLDALNRRYPNGMSLTDLHDNKIIYAQNGKFSPVQDPSVDNGAIANRAISTVLGKLVEEKAPGNIPVNDFNEYLSKYYKAADYLDSLNTKKAPVSTLQYIAHKGAQVVGAAIGHSVGGSVLGGVGGYMIGGALEHAIENMTIPMRHSFIKNLEITHPEIIPQLEEYLRKSNTGIMGNLALPPATTNSPIPLGPDTVTPNPSVAPYAAKTLPTRNPKTGRMQKTYSSLPK